MNRIKFAIAGVAVSAVATGTVLAEQIAFDASATILDALALTKVADLSFATIVPDASSAGTVTVSPASVRNCAPVLSCSGSVTAADFTVAGTNGSTYALTLPADANISNGSESMLVSSFTSNLPGSTGTISGGSSSFQLGATLNVGAAQAAGAYTGTFNVTVEYN